MFFVQPHHLFRPCHIHEQAIERANERARIRTGYQYNMRHAHTHARISLDSLASRAQIKRQSHSQTHGQRQAEAGREHGTIPEHSRKAFCERKEVCAWMSVWCANNNGYKGEHKNTRLTFRSGFVFFVVFVCAIRGSVFALHCGVIVGWQCVCMNLMVWKDTIFGMLLCEYLLLHGVGITCENRCGILMTSD